MNLSRAAVIVPCFNEEAALPLTLDDLLTLFRPSQIIVVNDGSQDNSAAIAAVRGVRVVNLPVNMGIGVAMQTGYRYARDLGFTCAVQCDGDGQHPPEAIPALLETLEKSGAAMALGSRFLPGVREGFQSLPLRRAGIRWLSFIIRLLTGQKVYDVTSGFRAVNRQTLELFAEDYPFDYPEPEALVLLKKQGLTVVETPVTMRERKGGVSSINMAKAVYYMVKVTIGLTVTRLRVNR